jgi:hypothetical protein
MPTNHPPPHAYRVLFEDGQELACADLTQVREAIEGYYPLVAYRGDAAFAEVDGRTIARIEQRPGRAG